MNSNFLKEDSIVVKRKSGGYYNDDGLYVNEVITTIVIYGNIQYKKSQISYEFNNTRQGGGVVLYTIEDLNLLDVIIWNGREYKILKKEYWEGRNLNYYRYDLDLEL